MKISVPAYIGRAYTLIGRQSSIHREEEEEEEEVSVRVTHHREMNES